MSSSIVVVRKISHATILGSLLAIIFTILTLFRPRMQCNLLQLLFQAMYRSVVSLVIRLFHILHNVACPVAADPRDVTPLIRCIIKDRVFHAASCLANSEGKRATDSNFADQFVLDSLKAGRMVPDLAIADSDFTI